MAQRHKIRVVYKSGHTEDFTCDDCKVAFSAHQNKLETITWKNSKPDTLYMNLESIATILKLK